MTPEDRAEMTRRLEQEALLHRAGFAPVLEDGSELFVRTGAEHLELYTRSHALIVALEELVVLDRGAPLFTNSLIRQREHNANDERGEHGY